MVVLYGKGFEKLRGISSEENDREHKFDEQKRRDYYNILNRRYPELRKASFNHSRIVDDRWGDYAERSTDKITVENVEDGDEQSNWNYRKPRTIRHKILDYKKFPKERISLNCVADRRLIQALDKYFAEGVVEVNGKQLSRRKSPLVGYYKTPRKGDNYSWLTRTDPITLYFMEPIDIETLKDIKKITEPFKNPEKAPESDLVFKEGEIDGANWMSYLTENQPEDIVKLIKSIEKQNPELAHAIYGFACSVGKAVFDDKNQIIRLNKDDKYTSLFRISAGQHFAIKETVQNYRKEISKVKIKFIPRGRHIGL